MSFASFVNAGFARLVTAINAVNVKASARSVPFVDASGTSNPVTLNAAGEIPFYDASGTANNVKVTA